MAGENVNYVNVTKRILKKVMLFIIFLYILSAVIPMVTWSFTRSWFWPSAFPQIWDNHAWQYIFSNVSKVPQAIATSVTIALIVMLLSILISLPSARVMGLYKFKGKKIIEILLLAPVIIPPMAVGLGLTTLFIRIGLSDTMQGVIIAHLIPTLPYVHRIISSTYETFDTRYEEQAIMLGAPSFKVFINVTFPILLPGVVTAALFGFVISLNEFVMTFLIGGGRVITLPVLLFGFVGGTSSFDYPIASAMAIVLSIPGIIFLFATERIIKEEYFSMGF